MNNIVEKSKTGGNFRGAQQRQGRKTRRQKREKRGTKVGLRDKAGREKHKIFRLKENDYDY